MVSYNSGRQVLVLVLEICKIGFPNNLSRRGIRYVGEVEEDKIIKKFEGIKEEYDLRHKDWFSYVQYNDAIIKTTEKDIFFIHAIEGIINRIQDHCNCKKRISPIIL